MEVSLENPKKKSSKETVIIVIIVLGIAALVSIHNQQKATQSQQLPYTSVQSAYEACIQDVQNRYEKALEARMAIAPDAAGIKLLEQQKILQTSQCESNK